ncbi:ribonuclease III [Algoriphagus sediminis]|uniref:Ribonuclease 3 n=1 Tax=Algoriphagus sediminis TaxID=3057113 RepID=A0ABT7Y7Z9_9BACT|nr:ribonuclease III [Algoriphagus sediminis]MDN3202575.1 ribonuclease III [Algoriphagus sediminis]
MSVFQKLGIQKIFFNQKDKRLASNIKLIVGRKPLNLPLYRLALTPAGLGDQNAEGVAISNERLEFLGDAVLGSIVADYLYIKYPYRNEGFLTETRAKIVNRETLHQVGLKIGLRNIFSEELEGRSIVQGKSLYGDMLEALIGAIYLDRGYSFCKSYILERLLIHIDVEEAIRTTVNYKSKIIEWSQKEGKTVEFKLLNVSGNQRFKEFTVSLEIDQEEISQGKGPNKKKAEQDACENGCKVLDIEL